MSVNWSLNYHTRFNFRDTFTYHLFVFLNSTNSRSGSTEHVFCTAWLRPYNCRGDHIVFSQIAVGTLGLLLHICDLSLQFHGEISGITVNRYWSSDCCYINTLLLSLKGITGRIKSCMFILQQQNSANEIYFGTAIKTIMAESTSWICPNDFSIQVPYFESALRCSLCKKKTVMLLLNILVPGTASPCRTVVLQGDAVCENQSNICEE